MAAPPNAPVPDAVVTATPGTYRISDSSAVAFPDALDAWTRAALKVLTDRARTYRATVGYGDLARALFARSGIATRSLLQNWIGDVLARVSDVCADPANDHPPLDALVVREADGTVGAGYADAVARHTGARPRDVEQHAADARLQCYRALARDLPADGGHATLTAKVPGRRRPTAAAPATPPPPPPPLCPTCFVQLPSSGQCDNCD